MNCYWLLEASGGANYLYDITMLYDDALLGTLGAESSLKLSRKSIGVNGTWKAHFDATVNTSTNQMNLQGTKGFSIWTGGDEADPLPVSLLNLTGNYKNNVVNLDWITSYEEYISHYEVEHSVDGINFNYISEVAALNNRFSESKYSIIHQNPTAGINYYRLRMIETNGKYTFSNIILVNITENKTNQISIQPNPAQDKINITILDQNQGATIQIFDITGRLIFNQKINLGQNSTQINIEKWIAGSYILRTVYDNGAVNMQKIIKVAE